MEKALTFFQVFDLAFFAPGAVLYMPLAHWMSSRLRPDGSAVDTVSAVITALVSVYGLGMLCHGIARLLLALMRVRPPTASTGTAWYTKLTSEGRASLAFYFWYLRATCWNLAVAVPLSALIGWRILHWSGWATVAGLLFGGLLVYLGREYDWSLAKVSCAGGTS